MTIDVLLAVSDSLGLHLLFVLSAMLGLSEVFFFVLVSFLAVPHDSTLCCLLIIRFVSMPKRLDKDIDRIE